MCNPTNKIQLCTCTLGEELPENYWILHRYVGKKWEEVIGEVVFPYAHNSKKYLAVHEIILNTLNAGIYFDKPIELKKKDILTLNLKNKKQIEDYSFIYTGAKWKKYELGPFELENHYDEKDEGLIKLNVQLIKGIKTTDNLSN